jgi:RimJ/RimL family protein N-acetyltransferase
MPTDLAPVMQPPVEFKVAVPVLRTARLILREPRVADLDAVAAFSASSRAGFVGGPMTRFESWRNILTVCGHWLLRGYGYWTIEEVATGLIAGRVGVHSHEEEWPEPELGWQVFEGFEGQGYAHEAALAARLQAGRMGLGPLISLVAPDNLRSRSLAERMGAAVEREIELLGKRVLLYRHPAGRSEMQQ